MSFVGAMPHTVVIPAKAGIHPSFAFGANLRLGWMAAAVYARLRGCGAMTVFVDEVAR